MAGSLEYYWMTGRIIRISFGILCNMPCVCSAVLFYGQNEMFQDRDKLGWNRLTILSWPSIIILLKLFIFNGRGTMIRNSYSVFLFLSCFVLNFVWLFQDARKGFIFTVLPLCHENLILCFAFHQVTVLNLVCLSQDARKGVLFIDFPPVLQLQLKRFEYDFMRDTMVKVSSLITVPALLQSVLYHWCIAWIGFFLIFVQGVKLGI